MTNRSTALDDVERAILYHLQTDARTTTNADLSERLDVSATTVGQRIDDLQDREVILTHHTMINYENAGFPHRVLLLCTVEVDECAEVADALIDQYGVISVRELITGEHNLHVEIVARTREELVEAISDVENSGVTVDECEQIKTECRVPFDDFQPE